MDLKGKRISSNVIDRRKEKISKGKSLKQSVKDLLLDLSIGTKERIKRQTPKVYKKGISLKEARTRQKESASYGKKR